MFGSGDINLSAAIISMGIRPHPAKPVELISRDNGQDYIRFHFMDTSDCGLYRADELSHAWASPESFRREFPNHPFVLLMSFISARPRGCSCLDDWLEHAATFLALPIDAVRKSYKDIGKVCAASPESPVSYICAFIRNRIDLITLAKKKQDAGDFTNMMDRSKSISMIPEKAPKRIMDFLLSHIR